MRNGLCGRASDEWKRESNSVNCSQFKAAIEALRAGAPGAAVCDQFRAHARSCPACASEFAPLLATKCQQITDFLSEYFEGQLGDEERRVFEFHMQACPECKCYLDSYRESIRLARDCAQPAPPPPQRLIDAILAARRGQCSNG